MATTAVEWFRASYEKTVPALAPCGGSGGEAPLVIQGGSPGTTRYRSPVFREHHPVGRGVFLARFAHRGRGAPCVGWHLNPETGCWLWVGAHDHYGYGRYFDPMTGRTQLAHRIIFGYAHPDIAFEHLTLDHLCVQRDCVNPDHLEPVTASENTRRMNERRHCQ